MLDPVSVFSFIAGLCLGSFLNVCIYRIPRGLSLLAPRSFCPNCRKPVAFYDNVPLFSFLFLGGRCRRCRGKISWRYPFVELLTALTAAVLAHQWRAENPFWILAAVLAGAMLIALSFIDWDTFLIPDPFSLGLLALGLLSSAFNPIFQGPWTQKILLSLAGAALGLGLSWATAWAGEKIFRKEALGGGDIKLLAGVGALLGPSGVVTTLILASFVGAAFGLALMGLKKISRQEPIPFGPFLSLGALVNLIRPLPWDFLFRLYFP